MKNKHINNTKRLNNVNKINIELGMEFNSFHTSGDGGVEYPRLQRIN